MAGAQPGLWAVQGGNKNVAEKLLKASHAKLIKGKATHVFQVKSEGGTISYEVQYEKAGVKPGDEDKTGSREYDILIMATPLQSGTKLKVCTSLDSSVANTCTHTYTHTHKPQKHT